MTSVLVRAGRAIAYAAAVVPAVAAFAYVAKYGVNVPISDDWAIAEYVLNDVNGALSFSDYFAQHNEHRILFPRLLMVNLASATDYDTVAEMYATVLMLLATAVVLVAALLRTLGRDAAFFVPIVAFLVFSFRQWEVMLVGFNVAVSMSVTFVVLALLLLLPFREPPLATAAFVGALAAATAASFSVIQGLVVWPAGLVVLTATNRRMPWIPIWAGAGLCASFLYFVDYRSVAHHPSPFDALRHPLSAVEYFLTLLGASLSIHRPVAVAVGIFLLSAAVAAVVATVRSRQWEDGAYWLALLLFSLLVLVTITIGRVGFGVEHARSSRYAPYSLLVVIATLALLARWVLARRSLASAALTGGLLTLVGTSVLATLNEGRVAGAAWRSARHADAFYVAVHRTAPDSAFASVYERTSVRRLAPTLERLGYSVFASREAAGLPRELSTLEPDARRSACVVERVSVNGVPTPAVGRTMLDIRSGAPLGVSGWCVDSVAGRAADGVYVLVDGRAYPGYYGALRPDVADDFAEPRYRESGFSRAIALRLHPGTHELAVIAVSSDSTRAYRRNPVIVLTVR